MPGIVTYAVPETGVYIEEYPNGARSQIGVYDAGLPGSENKMRVCPDGFKDHAVPMVRRLASGKSEWVFVDEIGYLESDSEAYRTALEELFAQKRVVAAVRRQNIPLLRRLRTREDVFCVDLDEPFGNTACVIMASGMSKRFGGNKLLADFHGQPMIRRILSATEGIFTRRLAVTRHPKIAQICAEGGIEVILHDQPCRSDTVRLGLEAVGDADGCMFCPADQPLLKQTTVAALALAAVADRNSIWRPGFGERHGAPVLFPQWAFQELMNLPQGRGGGAVVQSYPERVRILPVRDEWELADADDRETLELLLHSFSP